MVHEMMICFLTMLLASFFAFAFIKSTFAFFHRTVPPNLEAHCENWAGGYSARIVWNIPNGVWTTVEVNATVKNSNINDINVNNHVISGLQPAKRYKVSVGLLSGSERSADPFEFFCLTDQRGKQSGLKQSLAFSFLRFCSVRRL